MTHNKTIVSKPPKKSSLQEKCKPQPLTSTLRMNCSRWYFHWKTAFEFVAALVMLIVASPVILLAALLVKCTSRGPALYMQTRLGKSGRPYTIYKLRSMTHNCEKHSGPCWSSVGDARVTAVGRLLRETHIDELPQLWNVLRGDMSLVGPRPERPEFLPRLEEAVLLYRTRLLVKPGVTGLAQVQLPADTDMESVRRKIAYDLYYVQHCNAWMDFRLFFATALHVMCLPHVLVGKVLFLPRGRPVEQAYKNLIAEYTAPVAAETEMSRDSDPIIDFAEVPIDFQPVRSG